MSSWPRRLRRCSALAIGLGAGAIALNATLAAGCGGDGGAPAAKKIRQAHAPRVAQIVSEDLARHERGLALAADRVAAGFVKAKPERIEVEMRQALKLIRNPKRGIKELVISPMSFMASVGADGVVIARNAEPDRMKGMNLAKMFAPVRDALAGKQSYAIGEFENPTKGGKPSVTVVMAAPAHYGDDVVGALVIGVPLWRWSQRLSKQLQMEAAGKDKGAVLWVYLYRGDELHHHGTPPDLDELVPTPDARRAGYQKSPGGFTGTVQQYGFWYGYGVRPLPALGEDVGIILFRMDPK
ncbi:MAG: hypothetical protein OXU20_35495 [Myxococcales bacterium]|nr:hypothetical protein [Myxococcales bacterium]MDD9970164.1 hypothetical protein [Myxococcales bacterium]